MLRVAFVVAALALVSQRVEAGNLTGAIAGKVLDATTQKPIPDTILLAVSPGLQGEQTAITDDQGRYFFSDMPPGVYRISVASPGFTALDVPDVMLLVGRQITVNVSLLPEQVVGQEIVVEKQIPSVIDQGSTTSGFTLTRDYLERVTVGRDFSKIAEVAPGAQSDEYGTSFSGASSPENAIYIDGVNTVSPRQGTVTTTLPNEFLDQVEVKTGGYMPEYGNASGGIVNVITKIGGNDFHGTVFNYTTPLRLRVQPIGRTKEALSVTRRLAFHEELGFELGGPIVKDTLWFHVGLAPAFDSTAVQRQVQRLADDGSLERLPQYDQSFPTVEQVYRFTGKLTYNVTAHHRLTLGISGSPGTVTGFNGDVPLSAANGEPSSFLLTRKTNFYDVIANYDGKALAQHLLVNVVAGYHYQDERALPSLGADSPQAIDQRTRDLSVFQPEVAGDCTGRCPVTNYVRGGIGSVRNTQQDRFSARLHLTYLFSLLGTHQLKGGGEALFARSTRDAMFTGGEMQTFGEATTFVTAMGRLASADVLAPDAVNYLTHYRKPASYGNYAAFLQDSWNVLDRVTVNAGLRLDVQALPRTEGTSFNFVNTSPRLGVIYDFLGNGRSKLFASYGRFYQLVGAAVTEGSQVTPLVLSTHATCSEADPKLCPLLSRYFVGATYRVNNPIKAQYTDMAQTGLEYQIAASLLSGVTYTHSDLRDIMEVISPDNGAGYVVANIGQGFFAQGNDYPTLGGTQRINIPELQRRYDAISVYLTKSLANNFIGSASYTWSVLRGSYSGLFRSQDSASEQYPNLTFSHVLPIFSANNYGLLPADRTHSFKLDAAYIWPVSTWLALIPSANVRIASGTPYSYMGPYGVWGTSVITLLSRGIAGRSEPIISADVSLNSEWTLSQATRLFVGVTVLNVFDNQPATLVDEDFVRNDQIVRPIQGGDTRDLEHLKNERKTPAALNASFGTPRARRAPLELRINARLSF